MTLSRSQSRPKSEAVDRGRARDPTGAVARTAAVWRRVDLAVSAIKSRTRLSAMRKPDAVQNLELEGPEPPWHFVDRREVDAPRYCQPSTAPASRRLSRPRARKPTRHPIHHMLHDLTEHLLLQAELVDAIAVHHDESPHRKAQPLPVLGC